MRGRLTAAALAVICAVALTAQPARAAGKHLLREGWASAQSSIAELRALAEQAIVLGGAVLYQHRHTVAGATLGCAAGAALGTSSAVAAGLATGGVALAGTPQAAVLGCGIGAAGGAALGYPYDHIFDE